MQDGPPTFQAFAGIAHRLAADDAVDPEPAISVAGDTSILDLTEESQADDEGQVSARLSLSSRWKVGALKGSDEASQFGLRCEELQVMVASWFYRSNKRVPPDYYLLKDLDLTMIEITLLMYEYDGLRRGGQQAKMNFESRLQQIERRVVSLKQVDARWQ